jgi:hypothetical protein
MLAFSLSDRFLDCTILSQCVTSSVVRVPVKITISEVQGNRSNQRHSTSFHALAELQKYRSRDEKKKPIIPASFLLRINIEMTFKFRSGTSVQIVRSIEQIYTNFDVFRGYRREPSSPKNYGVKDCILAHNEKRTRLDRTNQWGNQAGD